MAEQADDAYFQQFLNKRPTLDELMKYARVSKKWHEFGVLLRLPDVELDAIGELNQDSNLKALKMFDLWLNTNPNCTRREVIEMLQKEAIGESAVAEEYVQGLKEKADVTMLRQVIDSGLSRHYISLRDLSWHRLHYLADQMYDADLISLDIQQSPSFDNIIAELARELNLMTSIHQIEQYCTKFLSTLNNMGGTCAQVSQVLQQDWIKDSRAKCGIELQLGPLQDKEKELEFIVAKKKDYSELLDKARKEGYVTIKWTKLFVSGPPGSGKSCIIKLLLDEDPPYYHHSTPVVAVPEVRMVTTTPLLVGEATQSFIKVDIDSLKEMLAEAIKKGVKPRSSSTVQSDRDDGSDHSSSDEAQDLEQQENELSLETVSQPQQLLSSPVSNATKEILERLPDVKESFPLFESHWIYAVDSGGQAAFLDMAPGLLRYNSVNILTHKLNEKLEDISKFYFSIKGEVIGNPVKRQITNLQLIEASFRSLTSVNPPNLPGIPSSVKDLEPVCLVLGTFYDKINDSGESLDEKNNKLYSTLKQYGDALILHHIRGKEVIFPVNTIAKDMNRQIIAKEIRHEICQSYTKADIPVRWFLFQLDLEQHQMTSNSSIVSKSECINIGSNLEMDEGDVNAALMYYHDLTIYLYFPEVLPNVVFVNPKPLLDKLSLLISISFTDAVDDLKRTLGIRVHHNTHEKLKIQGIFTRSLLTESLSQGFSKEFSADDFLKLMEYLFILSPLPQTGEYLLPCVLPTTTDLESLRASFKDKVDPLILTWNEKPLPQGLFPALIVSLLSRNCSPKFYLSTPRSDDFQFRNAICLECRSFAGAVLLVDGIYWLELFYTGPPNKCYDIYGAVKEGIKAVVNKFHYMHSLADPEERFHCPFCKQPEHFCHLNEDKTKLTCFINYSPVDKKRQLPWFTPEVKASFAHEIHEESEGDIVTMTTSHTKLDNTPLTCDMAKKVLIRSTDIIVESDIDPVVLARKLYAKEIMSDNVYDRVKDKATRDSNEDRLEAILSDLRSRVKNDASILMTFVDILKVDLKRQDLADKIMSKLN